MIFYFSYYINEGIIPPLNFMNHMQTIILRPNKESPSLKVLRYICDTRECDEFLLL